jgi:hypothetical protein
MALYGLIIVVDLWSPQIHVGHQTPQDGVTAIIGTKGMKLGSKLAPDFGCFVLKH